MELLLPNEADWSQEEMELLLRLCEDEEKRAKILAFKFRHLLHGDEEEK